MKQNFVGQAKSKFHFVVCVKGGHSLLCSLKFLLVIYSLFANCSKMSSKGKIKGK